MVFPRNHLLVTAIGDAWSEQEEWAFGFRVDRAAVPSGAEMTDLRGAFATFISSVGASVSSNARLLAVKVAPIGIDGRYPPGQDAAEIVLTPPQPGSSATGSLPQAALVVSLNTALSRGRGSKGRFYPPAFTKAPTATGQILLNEAEGMRTAALALLGSVQTTLLAPVVVGSALGEGSLRAVTAIRVGRVVDTQRRRRTSIAEAYVSASLPPP